MQEHVGLAEARGRRREPRRAVRRLEPGDGVVVVAQQVREADQAVLGDDVRPALRPGLALDVGQDLAALPVDAEEAGSGREAHGLEVPQQRMDGGRPRLHRAADGVADPHHAAVRIALQDLLGGRGGQVLPSLP